ncbi:hypothetical protein [Mycobacterium sp. IS-836]|uniref:hypothetical protein n=1 Tax=Mycobacterium sp. IS-836 TaxID=1834160 RepID=UPI0013018620|nr:hypothetical protein [Mycobacterium sp. IS-836]
MKVASKRFARIELEPGDTVDDLYGELGGLNWDAEVSIVNGALEVRDPEEE